MNRPLDIHGQGLYSSYTYDYPMVELQQTLFRNSPDLDTSDSSDFVVQPLNQGAKKKVYYLKNKDKISKQCKKYYLKHREKIIHKTKKYYKENKSKISEYQKKWAKKNKNRLKQQKSMYYKNNKLKWDGYIKKRLQNPEFQKLRKEYRKKYCKENKEKLREFYMQYHKKHRDKILKYRKIWGKNNKELVKGWRAKNKDRIHQLGKNWRENNKEKVMMCNKNYNKNNREKIRVRMMKWREKITNRLRVRLSIRIWDALKNNSKSQRTMKLIGCSIEYLKQHLESKFTFGMNWKNYGFGWHLDHIKPCASFDLSKEEEQKKCFHYTNLQPLWATENLKKGERY